jgi:hypothetical protein
MGTLLMQFAQKITIFIGRPQKYLYQGTSAITKSLRPQNPATFYWK